MICYRRVQREELVPATITCNKCGNTFEHHQNQGENYTLIQKIYSYGSNKDGDKYVSHVCEPCMDAFYATFALPPQVVGMVVWGEDPGDPKLLVDDPGSEPIAE